MRPADSFYFFCFLLLVSGATQASPGQEPAEPARATAIATLLELQRSGKLASAHRQALPGPAQSRAWQRYIDSFATPIPARYIDDSFKAK